ncbi:DUF1980 domain-containing protein [Paenibacillus sp. SYP-B3998]|uniref:DUF1980 domain-containing protein n=1 Tax=Paenibacillus sp. SYP-B3998 TaxID=2678564 RepID=A0A6G3ZR00_9BACL|nr:DUF1980 domain-containing protein [Paenibacillus sp. SYP-B3998]NEW04633.1 DUF1980 domain-containing protein [Paenibacillus sp. SYP-B3998]
MKISSAFAHRTIRAAVLIAFVFFIVWISQSDALSYYVAPRMELWVKGLAVGLYVLAMHQLYLAVRDVLSKKKTAAITCACSSHSHDQWKPSVIIMYGALIVPLVLAFLFPDAVLGSQMAAKKGLNLTPSGILLNSNSGDAAPNLIPNNNWIRDRLFHSMNTQGPMPNRLRICTISLSLRLTMIFILNR